MDVPVVADEQECIYISSVRTQDVVWKTCQEQWMIETDGDRESGKAMLSVQHDDGLLYEYIYIYIYIYTYILYVYTYMFTHTHTHIYIYIHSFVVNNIIIA